MENFIFCVVINLNGTIPATATGVPILATIYEF